MDDGPFAVGAKAGETGADTQRTGPGSTWKSLGDDDRRLLRLLTEGRTNAEIAAELAIGENDVAQRLARLQARLGTSSRAESTSLAFRGLAMSGSG
jgi:DNA-binding CsgD family transcriptional regulator